MKIVCLIPARLDSKRFHGKLLKTLGGKSVINRTYDGVRMCGGIDDLYVVTNSKEINEHVKSFGGKSIFEDREFKTGTDRISSVCEGIDSDFIINVQGDEPFINCNVINELVNQIHTKQYETYTVVTPINEVKEVTDQNTVKAIVNKKGELALLTRCPIKTTKPLKHVGVYAYSKDILLTIPKMGESDLEENESIEYQYLKVRHSRLRLLYSE